MQRFYINGAPQLSLGVTVNTSAVSLTVSSTAGYPPSFPYIIALERGTVNEEVCLVTAATGTVFTVIRGWDGSTAKAHTSGAIIEHTTSAVDYQEANSHISDVTRNDHTQYPLKAAWAAKGSLAVATAASTPANLAVGADATVLIADSSQASGLRWATLGTANITDATVTLTDLDAALKQKVVQVSTTTGAFGTGAAGELLHTTGDKRWNGYNGTSWIPIASGVGLITISNGAPSGGADGDVWLRY